MASISSLTNSSSSASSIYGNRNIISGLVSGMDTEALIENCIKGYQTKIAKLQQQQTKVTWRQDAYRNITDKLLAISQKYTSYTSKTNLSSPGFFLNSVNTTTNGINASKVSATGRTSSEIKLNAVKQLASAARYSSDAKVLETKATATGAAVDFNQKVQLTKLSGDITLTVGGNKVSLTFDDDEIIRNASELTSAINKKLSETELGNDKASTRVKAVNSGGTIRFETIGESKASGDAVWISSAYGDIKDTLGITAGALGKGDTSLNVSGKQMYEQVDRKEYLSNQTINITLDGKTASVVLGDLTKVSGDPSTEILKAMQNQADAKFGKDKIKFDIKDGAFTFTTDAKDKDGNIAKVQISSSAGAALGFGSDGLSNALTTKATLGNAFGSEFGKDICNDIWVSSSDVRPGPGITEAEDRYGNPIKKEGGVWYYLTGTGSGVADLNQEVTIDKVRPKSDAKEAVDKDNKKVTKHEDGNWYYDAVDPKEIRPDGNSGVDKDGKQVIKKDDQWYYVGYKADTTSKVETADVTPNPADSNIGTDKDGKQVILQDGVWYHSVSTNEADTTKPVSNADEVRIAADAVTGVDKDGKKVTKHKDGKWYYEKVNFKDIRPAANATEAVNANGRKVIKSGDKWYYEKLGEEVDKKYKVDPNDVRLGSNDPANAVDKNGNKVYQNENGTWYRKSDKADLVINGVKIGSFDKNTTIEEILNEINNNSKVGVKASYSKLTNRFVLTASETGSEGKIEISGKLGEALFGKTEPGKAEVNLGSNSEVVDSEGNALVVGKDESGKDYYLCFNEKDGKYYKARLSNSGVIKPITDGKGKPVEASMDDKAVLDVLKKARKGYEEGKDAIFNVTVNGDTRTLTRSSNVIDMDGMTVTLNDVFNNEKDANGVSFFDENNNLNKNAKLEKDSVVTFTTKADSDKIVEAVQEFIKEFNEITTLVRTEYSTTPLKNTNKRPYEPLTDEDREGMTETQIKEYEEKAKTGLLFGDTDLSSLHNSLRTAITPSGDLRKAMSEIGLKVTYEGGVTSLTLDETKFRAAIDKDMNAVQKVFTANTENGDTYNGLMARTKRTIDSYASTSIGNFGLLVRKAGTKTKSLSLRDNTLQKQYDNLEDQIERWRDKMSDKVDYYTRQFTKLEQLMNQMNSQSSALAGLTGGY